MIRNDKPNNQHALIILTLIARFNCYIQYTSEIVLRNAYGNSEQYLFDIINIINSWDS